VLYPEQVCGKKKIQAQGGKHFLGPDIKKGRKKGERKVLLLRREKRGEHGKGKKKVGLPQKKTVDVRKKG